MEKKEMVGTKDMDELDAKLDRNQDALVDLLVTPNSNRIAEMKGAKHRIVSKVPAYNPEAQPVQARGRVVWNTAYKFQPGGPSFLDPVPDPSSLTEAQ